MSTFAWYFSHTCLTGNTWSMHPLPSPIPHCTFPIAHSVSSLTNLISTLPYSLPTTFNNISSCYIHTCHFSLCAGAQCVTILFKTSQYCWIRRNTLNTSQYCWIRHNTVQYVTIQFKTSQYCSIRHNTVKNITILLNTPQYCSIRHTTVEYVTLLLNTSHYCWIRHNTVEWTSGGCGVLYTRGLGLGCDASCRRWGSPIPTKVKNLLPPEPPHVS